MARVRRANYGGAREAFRGHIEAIVDTYPGYVDEFVNVLAALDRGDVVSCHGYEVDLMPPMGEFELLPDGSAVPVPDRPPG